MQWAGRVERMDDSRTRRQKLRIFCPQRTNTFTLSESEVPSRSLKTYSPIAEERRFISTNLSVLLSLFPFFKQIFN